jgi:hypothetical protein
MFDDAVITAVELPLYCCNSAVLGEINVVSKTDVFNLFCGVYYEDIETMQLKRTGRLTIDESERT